MTARILRDIIDALTENHPGPTDQPDVVGPRDVARARVSLENLLQQAPMRYQQRQDLLTRFSVAAPFLERNHRGDLVATAGALRHAVLRIPPASTGPLELPDGDDILTAAFQALIELDVVVSEPWTLIGGLMVLAHCLERDVPFTRPTRDADVAVSVFTHRRALARVTSYLRDSAFLDVSPPALPGDPQLSYQWARGEVKFDIAVPPKANEQHEPPATVTGRPAVELPATQQALRRTGTRAGQRVTRRGLRAPTRPARCDRDQGGRRR